MWYNKLVLLPAEFTAGQIKSDTWQYTSVQQYFKVGIDEYMIVLQENIEVYPSFLKMYLKEKLKYPIEYSDPLLSWIVLGSDYFLCACF